MLVEVVAQSGIARVDGNVRSGSHDEAVVRTVDEEGCEFAGSRAGRKERRGVAWRGACAKEVKPKYGRSTSTSNMHLGSGRQLGAALTLWRLFYHRMISTSLEGELQKLDGQSPLRSADLTRVSA